MKKSKSGSSRYKQGKFVPKNLNKYIGIKSEIFYRSSWEYRYMMWLDENESVLAWNSEGAVIPYFSPVDQKMHRYFVDFLAKMRTRDGSEKTYAIEVKPKVQMLPPTTKNKIRLVEETMTYVVNQAKWEAARTHFSKMGIHFIVINEDDLFGKQK